MKNDLLRFNRKLPKRRGCLKSRLLSQQPVEFKIKSLYYNDLILNVAHKIKEAVQKLQFLDSPEERLRLIKRLSNIFEFLRK